MSVTSDAWPIYVPGDDGQPVDAILSHIATHGLYTVADATERATLLTDLATAGADDTYIAVRRLDATAGQEIEYTVDGGSTWQVIRAEKTGDTWTPTYAGITAVGDGTVTTRVARRDGWVYGMWHLVVGASTTFAGATTVNISLPETSLVTLLGIGQGYATDASASGAASRKSLIAVAGAAGANITLRPVDGDLLNDTVPFTWATGDTIGITFAYPYI